MTPRSRIVLSSVHSMNEAQMMALPQRCTSSARVVTVVAALLVCILVPASARAEDAVYKGTDTPLQGDVTSISRSEVVLKGRTNKREYRIPANEIDRIRWGAEKPQLNQVRIEERNGQFDKALANYESLLTDVANDNVRTDIEFLIARTTTAKALAGDGKYDGAINRLEKFRTTHPNSYHYFDCLRLLTRTYLAKGDVERAGATLKLMSEAPWNDYKMDAENFKARAALARGDVAGALKALENVTNIKPNTPAELSRHYEALLTKASCLQKQAKFQEATNVLMSIIDEASDQDKKTLAETCVRLGDCQQAAGRTKEAILAYLRVDILFPKEKDQHAEALYYLSRLFAQDGKPDKGFDAAARLQEAYPHSPWTAKLTSAPK